MLIDLTHCIDNGMPVYPGTEDPFIERPFLLPVHGYREARLQFVSHTGTHIDAPAHMIEKGTTLDRLPAERFTGRCLLLDVRQQDTIPLPFLTAHEKEIRKSDFLLFWSDWSRFWGSKTYFSGFPVLEKEASRWLVSLQLKGVGMDAISFDPVDTVNYDNHIILLKAGLILLENLVNLDAIPRMTFQLICMPLKFKDSDGAPARIMAQV